MYYPLKSAGKHCSRFISTTVQMLTLVKSSSIKTRHKGVSGTFQKCTKTTCCALHGQLKMLENCVRWLFACSQIQMEAAQHFLEHLMLLDADQDNKYVYSVSFIQKHLETAGIYYQNNSIMWIVLPYHLHRYMLNLCTKACSTS